MTGSLSSALQGSSVSANDGQNLVKKVVKTLQSMRSDEFFDDLWKSVQIKRQKLEIEEPILRCKRRVPRRLDELPLTPEVQDVSVQDTYRRVYYEVLYYVMNAITQRFGQDGFKILCKLEELLCDSNIRIENSNDILCLYGEILTINSASFKS